MTTVADIAKAAFDGVAASITDAVKAGILNDGAADYAGRVVFTSERAPSGFPMSKAKDRVETAILEGFDAVPVAGWTLAADSITFYVLAVRDIVRAGGAVIVRLIAANDMLWKSVSIESQTRTDDGAGGYTEGWATRASVQGGMVAMSGQEVYASARIEERSRWMLVIPHTVGVVASDRAVIDGVSYDIQFVDDHEKRGVWMVLHLGGGVAP